MQLGTGTCRQNHLSEQVLGGGNELMVDDPFRQQTIIIGGNAGGDRAELGQDAVLPKRPVPVVSWHAAGQTACKPNQDGLAQLDLCTLHISRMCQRTGSWSLLCAWPHRQPMSQGNIL